MAVTRLPAMRRFAKSTSGATAVEFAFVAVPLIALIFAALQTATILFLDQAIQTVAEQSGRQLMTGTAQQANLSQSQFQQLVCNNLPPVFQCSNIIIDVQSGPSFSSINTAPLTVTYDGKGAVTNNWSYNPGNPGDIVIMRVMYNWTVVDGPLHLGLATQANGTALLVGTAVFKNEPYQ